MVVLVSRISETHMPQVVEVERGLAELAVQVEVLKVATVEIVAPPQQAASLTLDRVVAAEELLVEMPVLDRRA
jgi:hypothetical protein